MRKLVLMFAVVLLPTFVRAQVMELQEGPEATQPRPVRLAAPPAPDHVIYLRCGSLWDGKSDALQPGALIKVQGERIAEIARGGLLAGAEVIDLSNQTCLPGLIDTHTHVYLQGDRKPGQYDAQLLKQSEAYRAIEATTAAHAALMYGFTTIRDLETEGAGYGDVDIRNAINRGVVPGPRMKVVGRAMDVTGAYPLEPAYAWDITVPIGVQTVDGVEGARKAVREQISHGTDWVKIYADRGNFIQPNGVIEDIPTFTLDETRAITDEAHRERHKVAAHATGNQGVHTAVEGGVDTIEHGNYMSPEDIKTMAARGIYYVPTLFVAQYDAELRAAQTHSAVQETRGMKIHCDTFHRALDGGVKIAFGTDAGAFEWDVNAAREFPLMVKCGMSPLQALRSATVVASELMDMQKEVGTIETGKFADIVAVPGNPLSDVSVLEKVGFVMKGGTVWKESKK